MEDKTNHLAMIIKKIKRYHTTERDKNGDYSWWLVTKYYLLGIRILTIKTLTEPGIVPKI